MVYGQRGPRGHLVPSRVVAALVTGRGIATILHRPCWVMTAWENKSRLKYATTTFVMFEVRNWLHLLLFKQYRIHMCKLAFVIKSIST